MKKLSSSQVVCCALSRFEVVVVIIVKMVVVVVLVQSQDRCNCIRVLRLSAARGRVGKNPERVTCL